MLWTYLISVTVGTSHMKVTLPKNVALLPKETTHCKLHQHFYFCKSDWNDFRKNLYEECLLSEKPYICRRRYMQHNTSLPWCYHTTPENQFHFHLALSTHNCRYMSVLKQLRILHLSVRLISYGFPSVFLRQNHKMWHFIPHTK